MHKIQYLITVFIMNILSHKMFKLRNYLDNKCDIQELLQNYFHFHQFLNK